MAEGRSYGDLLREARERRGIDLVSMARALHIRPDIVGAIENGDFRKMPAHGYTKNMVRAYARQVGLDEGRISQMYADQRAAFDGAPPPSRQRRRNDSSDPRADGRRPRTEERSRRFTEDVPMRTDARSRSLSHRGASSARSEARSRSVDASVNDRAHGVSDLIASLGSRSSQRPSTVRSSFTQGGMATSLGTQSRRSGGSLGTPRSLPAVNLPVILAIVGAVAVIIMAVILFNGGKQSVDDVPDIPISGLTDTSAVDENDQSSQLATAPSSAIFSFSVKDGEEAWVTIYQDGDSTPVYAAVAEGPVTEDFEVTGTLTFETANIAAITLTVDGEEVTAKPASSGTNYVYVVDFPAILAEWKQEHGMGDSQDADTNATEGNTDRSSSTNTEKGSSSNNSSTSNTSSSSN